jgi:TrmH family RNA methyltransferase
MNHLLGLHSPQLDPVKALRSKAGREALGRHAIEGSTLLAEALAAGRHVEELYLTEKGRARLGAALLRAHAARTFLVADRTMAKLSELDTPSGILAVMSSRREPLDDLLDGAPALVLAGVADPGNAGTLLRSAEIFGITRAAFTPNAVEAYNPKVVRAAMGAHFRMRLAVASGPDIVRAARERGYGLVAAARGGRPLPEVRFPSRLLLAIGNERRGVSDSLPACDLQVAIPQPGGGESLNAAIAGSILMYVFSQQFGSPDLRSETVEKR